MVEWKNEFFAIFVVLASMLNLVYAALAWAQAKKCGKDGSSFISTYSIWYIILSLIGFAYGAYSAHAYFSPPASV
jgi:hypothetical protein